MGRETRRIFDDASRHYGGEWPDGLPTYQAYVHTGLYLGWLVQAGLCSDRFQQQNAADVAAFQAGDISGPELFRRTGGVLSSDMLSDEGHAFTAEYFDLEHGQYLTDYGHLLADIQRTAYHVPDSEDAFRRISERVQHRYELWKGRRAGSVPRGA